MIELSGEIGGAEVKVYTKGFVFIGLILILGILIYLQSSENKTESSIIKGAYHYEDGKIINLSGEWAFIWQRFALEKDFDQQEAASVHYVQVPSMWNNYKMIPWQNYEHVGLGYGSFHLTIDGLTPNETYGFKVRNFGTSGEVFINGRSIVKMGQVSEDMSDSVPYYGIKYVSFVPEAEEIHLVIHITNSNYARGGFWVPIVIGQQEDIENLRDINAAKSYMSIGVLIAVVLLLVTSLFFTLEKDGILYLLMGSILVIAYIMVTGDKLFLSLFPRSGDLVIRLQYTVMYLSPIPILGYAKAVVFKENKMMIMAQYLISVYTFLMMLTVVFMPMYDMTQFNAVGNIVTLLVIGFVIINLIVATYRGQKDCDLIIIAFIILGGGIVHDFLYNQAIIHRIFGEVLALTYVVFILMMTFILGNYVRKACIMSKKVPSLEQAYLNAQIKPHFLFNTLNAIASLIDNKPDIAEDMTVHLSTYLRYIMGYDNLQQLVGIDREIEMLESYIEIEQIRFENIHIEIIYDESLYFKLPPMVLQPLVENALKHGLTPNNNTGTVKVIIERVRELIRIAVSDDGVGIEEQRRSDLLKSFDSDIYEDGERGHVGLKNVYDRMKKTKDAQWHIISGPGLGTTIEILFKV